MSRSPNFLTRMIAVVLGVLLLVASAAFLTIPYSLGGHPGEVVAIGAGQPSFHPS
jgi:hypothetical protein